MEYHMINAKINHLIEAMKIDLEMDLSTIRKETRDAMENFLFLHRLRGETCHKKIILPTKK